MDKNVLDLSPEEQLRLSQLQKEVEGLDLIFLLKKIMSTFAISANQLAVSAQMDESAFHKILAGEHREFKAEHVDFLLEDLEELTKLVNPHEKAIWRRALHIAAFLHFNSYKVLENRLRHISDLKEKEKIIEEYLSNQYPALNNTYDSTGGRFPIFIPIVHTIARQILDRFASDNIKKAKKDDLINSLSRKVGRPREHHQAFTKQVIMPFFLAEPEKFINTLAVYSILMKDNKYNYYVKVKRLDKRGKECDG